MCAYARGAALQYMQACKLMCTSSGGHNRSDLHLPKHARTLAYYCYYDYYYYNYYYNCNYNYNYNNNHYYYYYCYYYYYYYDYYYY